MVKRMLCSIIDRIIGKTPRAYTINCMNASCNYREHVMVSTRFEDEPYIENHVGTRTLKKLPGCCPKCGCKNLRKSEVPPLR